jgi:5-methylthioadenosine/S-adenosylhomocysteine deaminase
MGGSTTVALRGGLVVTQDEKRRVFRGDVLISGDRVLKADRKVSERAEIEVDASRFLVAPGFINLHTHVANTLLRGVADDMDFARFLETMFSYDAYRQESDIEAGAMVGISEMLLTGSTSFLDMYYGEDAVARACEQLGMRGFLGWTVLDKEMTTQKGIPLENARSFIHRWKGNHLVTPLAAPQGVYVCSEETLLSTLDLARTDGCLIHYHLSETLGEVEENVSKRKLRPVEWLDKIGFLGQGQVAAHSVWLTNHEIELLASRKVSTAHCPSSNMKLASGGGGLSPVTELRERGVAVGLGTDSSTSNNSLSMLREIHLAGLAHKHGRHDPKSLPAQTLLDMATVDGARALGKEGELGSISPGHLADLVLYDLRHPSLTPTTEYSAVSNLVYSANEGAVHTVYVGGRKVVEEGKVVLASDRDINVNALSELEALRNRARRANIVPENKFVKAS